MREDSLPDWLAMRSGRFGVFPDGVAFPKTAQEIRELMRFAQAHDYCLIPMVAVHQWLVILRLKRRAEGSLRFRSNG